MAGWYPFDFIDPMKKQKPSRKKWKGIKKIPKKSWKVEKNVEKDGKTTNQQKETVSPGKPYETK